MQTHWLTRKGGSSCILFFAGWGMDPAPFTAASSDRHDLLMIYDYRVLTEPDLTDLAASYQNLHLVAWSMGVWVAARLLAQSRTIFTTTVALNGTLNPIDDRLGIAEKTFDAMIDSFTAEALEAFYAAMFDNPKEAEQFMRNRPRRLREGLLEELIVLRNAARTQPPVTDIYSRKLVGSRDRIFPSRSQLRSWGKDNCSVLRIPHFPFYGKYGLNALI